MIYMFVPSFICCLFDCHCAPTPWTLFIATLPSRPWTSPSLQLARQLNTKHRTSIRPRAHLFPLYLKSLSLQPMHCDYRKASCCMSLMCIGSPRKVEDTNKDEFGALSMLKAGAITLMSLQALYAQNSWIYPFITQYLRNDAIIILTHSIIPRIFAVYATNI